MKPGDFKETERIGGHVWGHYKDWTQETCLYCMTIRRRDRKNPPCRGVAKLRPMEKLT
jgi:hypothetical protein